MGKCGQGLTDGTTIIGAYKVPGRKRPGLCIEKENKITVYGLFRDEESADEFMEELAKFVHAEDKREEKS